MKNVIYTLPAKYVRVNIKSIYIQRHVRQIVIYIELANLAKIQTSSLLVVSVMNKCA